jgi:carbon-monoxide dehydrogenase medium subunit
MKAGRFSYHRPATVTEAVQLLGRLPNARILAGGQSLVPMLNLRVALPDHLVDINRVAGLDTIDKTDGRVRTGAMVRQSTLQTSAVIHCCLPLLSEAPGYVGHDATRARGTLGGSLCHLDPAAELPIVALAYDASMHIEGPLGSRIVPASEFQRGPMTADLADAEMLVALEWAPWPDGHGWGFAEFSQQHGDFAVVLAAALLHASKDGIVTRAVLVLGGMGFGPVRVRAAEDILVGSRPDAARLAAAAAFCGAVEATDDARFPAWYRKRLAAVMGRRALDAACARMAA